VSIEYFARAFFPHYCRDVDSPFHRDLYRLFIDKIPQPVGSRIAIAAPRESAKSTLAVLMLPLWCICYPKTAWKRYVIITSDTQRQAEDRLAEIRYELEGNERLAEAFPEATGAGPAWTQADIITRNGIKVTARGTGGNIRGLRHGPYRPDLLIGDDLENDENSQTPAQRDKITNWFFKAFCKAGVKTADVAVVGTILHYDSLLSRLLVNPAFHSGRYQGVIRWAPATALWEQWERIYTDGLLSPDERQAQADRFYQEHERELIFGTEVLWPEHRSYYDLMKLRVAEGPASFDSEIQNEPINPDDCLFREEWFQWFDEDELDWKALPYRVAAIDPSLGKRGKHGDPSAIVCLGRDRHGTLYVLDADIERRTPDKIIEDALELYDRRGLSALGVETTQFQEFFRQQLERIAAERGKYPPIRAIEQTTDKTIRIQRLQPLVKNGRIKFQRKHKTLFDQLRYFPKADHDDGPDALEMAVSMIERVMHVQAPSGKSVSRHSRLKEVFG